MDNNLIMVDARPSRADAVKNREILLETARRLFHEQGVDAVSMTTIAQEAGVGKGTLYRHFTNKIELCEALLDENQRILQVETLQRLAYQGDPLADLRWFVRAVATFVEDNRPLLVIDGGTSMLGHPAHLWWRQTIRALLQKINTTADVDYLADVVYVMLDIRTAHFQRIGMNYDFQRLLDGLDTLILRLAHETD
jgi:AcrR family transcriptional regulator